MNAELIGALERFGGWVVVIIIVKWMMAGQDRAQRQVQELVEGFKQAVATFTTFEAGERETHEKIIETQELILAELKALRARE